MFSLKVSPKNAKNADFNVFFAGLILLIKTDAVLDHLPGSVKVKFMGSHGVKKQLLYCLVEKQALYSEGLRHCEQYCISLIPRLEAIK